MIAAALAFLRTANWKMLAGGAALLVALLYVGWLNLSIARLHTTVAEQKVKITGLTDDLKTSMENTATALRVNSENLIEIERIKQDRSVMESTLAEVQRVVAIRNANAQNTQREIQRVIVKTPAQCELAPSLLVVLDELRARARSRASGGGQDPARAGGAPG